MRFARKIYFWQESSNSLSASANTEFCEHSATILPHKVPLAKTFTLNYIIIHTIFLYNLYLCVNVMAKKLNWNKLLTHFPLHRFPSTPSPIASFSLLINHYLPSVSPRAPPLPIPMENALHADTKVTFRQRQTNTVCNIYRYAYLTLSPSTLYFPPLLPPPLLVPTPLEWRSYEDEWCL